MFCFSDIFLFFICHLSLSIVYLLILVVCTQIEHSYCPLTADWLQVCFLWCMFKERRAGPSLLRLMYITETLINPLFTDVDFRRNSDRSGHNESGGSCPPPSPVPYACLLRTGFHLIMLTAVRKGYKRSAVCRILTWVVPTSRDNFFMFTDVT